MGNRGAMRLCDPFTKSQPPPSTLHHLCDRQVVAETQSQHMETHTKGKQRACVSVSSALAGRRPHVRHENAETDGPHLGL